MPPAQIVYLADERATRRQIETAFARHLAAAPPEALLLAYYCGHGYKDDASAEVFFAPHDASAAGGWGARALVAAVEEHFNGARVMLAADACHSGALADAVHEQGRRHAYACLASSCASELSTSNWTFTEGLLAGLRGQCYVDGDHTASITLAELAALLEDDMAFAEEQRTTFATAGGFDAGLVLAAAQPRADAAIGRRVEVRSAGAWYRARIIDAQDGQYLVHYFGWEDADDEWVAPDQIREAALAEYPAGAAVEVLWKKRWFPATILENRSGLHHIRYDGYGADWDEWASSRRIRQP